MAISAPNSEVDICNLALVMLQQELVTQIDPPTTTTENLCSVLYHQIRRRTLRSHTWNFALKRVSLTPDTGNKPLFGFLNSYLLPNDYVRYVGRYDDIGSRIIPDDYQIEDNHILLNNTVTTNTSINVRYLYDHVNVVRWDALFVELFSINLAIHLAPNFSRNEKRIEVLLLQQKNTMSEAAAVDGQERPPVRIQRSKFIQARRGVGLGSVADKFTRFSS